MSDVEFLPGRDAEYADAPPPPPPPATAEAPPASPRLGRRSLIYKLTVGVVGLVVLLVLVIGGGTYYSLRIFLGHRLDSQLQTTSHGSLNTLFDPDSAPGAGLASPVGVFAVALNTDGSHLRYPNSEAVRALKLTASDRVRLAAAPAYQPMTIETENGTQVRVVTRPTLAQTKVGTVVRAVAVIGLSTGEEKRTMHRLLALELLIGGAAVLIAIGATYGGVRFSLRRLRRVTDTAQEVAAELSPDGAGLEHRVPVTEQGTEVGQLTDSMNTLLAAVETQFAARVESEERMRTFLADASHELRTPLTSIRGFAELARMQRAIGQPDEDNLGRIESEGTRMSRLVEDLLMLARGDAADNTSTPHVPVDVTQLIDDAVASARAAFTDREFVVDITPPWRVLGDYDQLLRVLRNLLTNAAVHTRAEAAIRVRGFADGTGMGRPGVVLQVVDGGPGLPPEEAAHVFERFWRADKARTRARGGSGLGMSIVASIVRAHGGTVGFDSTVEGGSTVTVWLPAAPVPAAAQ